MADQQNPYAPFIGPFRYDGERNIVDVREQTVVSFGYWLGGGLSGAVAIERQDRIARRIVALLNADAQPSPDLEPVRQWLALWGAWIEARKATAVIDPCPRCDYGEGLDPEGQERMIRFASAIHAVTVTAEKTLSALRSLLAEVEKWRMGSRPESLVYLREQAKDHSLAAKQAYINGLEYELSHLKLEAEQSRTLRKELDTKDEQIKSAALEIAERGAELAAAQATIAEQGAVIAAMRDKFVKIVTDGHPECGCYYHAAQASANLNTAQLAADHDAAVRADERRKVLEEVRQIIDSTLDDDPIESGEIERRIEQLAAQPEEAGE